MNFVLESRGSSEMRRGPGTFPAEIPATAKPNIRLRPSFPRNPFSPPSAPVQMRLQSPPAKSKFPAVKAARKATLAINDFRPAISSCRQIPADSGGFSTETPPADTPNHRICPLFPPHPPDTALRSGPTAGSGATRQKQILAAHFPGAPGGGYR
jgi:hypothetical protein